VIYLASPYSDVNPEVRQQRFEAACKAAARLMNGGRIVFCPVAHSHGIAELGFATRDWEFWRVQSLAMLRLATELMVLKLPGWDVSVGINAELMHAKTMGMPIRYMEAK